jgi:hypothetical protein
MLMAKLTGLLLEILELVKSIGIESRVSAEMQKAPFYKIALLF